jgi:hypothetical protein
MDTENLDCLKWICKDQGKNPVYISLPFTIFLTHTKKKVHREAPKGRSQGSVELICKVALHKSYSILKLQLRSRLAGLLEHIWLLLLLKLYQTVTARKKNGVVEAWLLSSSSTPFLVPNTISNPKKKITCLHLPFQNYFDAQGGNLDSGHNLWK